MTYDLVIWLTRGGASVYVKIQCLKFTIGSYGSEHSICNLYSVARFIEKNHRNLLSSEDSNIGALSGCLYHQGVLDPVHLDYTRT